MANCISKYEEVIQPFMSTTPMYTVKDSRKLPAVFNTQSTEGKIQIPYISKRKTTAVVLVDREQ